MMRVSIRRLVTLGALLVGVTTALPAQQTIARGRVREGRLSFDGHATTGDFVGATTR
jgi:hypothetical protein